MHFVVVDTHRFVKIRRHFYCCCRYCNIYCYKITEIVRALSLAERRVCMRVCKHGCVT